MANEPQQEFELLEALAKVSARDFRLGQFMASIGLDPSQTNLFYRQLIKEAKENESFINSILNEVGRLEEAKSQLQTALSAKEEQLRTQQAKLRSLQDGTHLRSEALDKERQRLLELQGKVLSYNALIQLLSGEVKPTTLKAASELFWDAHTKAQYARIEGQPLPDPAVLEKARQQLRQELRDILRIPPEELEKEMEILRAKNAELQKSDKVLATMNMAQHNKILELMDKIRSETTEERIETSLSEAEKPRENNKTMTQENESIVEYLKSLTDKRSNETTEGGG